MNKRSYSIICLLVLQACSNCTTRNYSAAPLNNVSSVKAIAANQNTNLIGDWETKSVESNIPEFRNAQRVIFCVYSYEQRLRDSGIQLINAELLVQEPGNRLHLIVDAQPVGQIGDKLYMGPIGSAYLFTYTISNQVLSLNLVSDGRAYLRLKLGLVSREPGPMRFPPGWFNKESNN